jgi:hypothetical protein
MRDWGVVLMWSRVPEKRTYMHCVEYTVDDHTTDVTPFSTLAAKKKSISLNQASVCSGISDLGVSWAC